jgi:outer membrane protein
MKRILSIITVIVIWAVIPPAFAMGLDVNIGTGNQSITGDLAFQGTKMSLQDTLGLADERQIILSVRIEHPIPILPNLYYRYIPSSFTGSKTNTTAIKYGGKTFDAKTVVTSTVELNRHDIGLYYDLPVNLATAGILKAALGLNVRVIDFKGDLAGTVGGVAGIKANKSITAPIPQLFGRLSVTPVKFISINGEIRWLGIGNNSLSDFTVEFRIKPVSIFYAGAGYFRETATIDTDDVKAGIDIAQSYLFVGAEF